MTFGIVLGPRLAKSPYFDCTVAAGAQSFTVYNHTLMPMSYGDADAEYWRLIKGVVMWDVAAQTQVELSGPDASRLAQALVCRDLSSVVVGQAKYAPMVDHQGRLINDPVILRVGQRRWWLSLADSDMVYWCRAIAAERGLRAEVKLPDVSPLAVQGPAAVDVVADLLGEWVRRLGRFKFRFTKLDGIEMWVGRSGWSKQGGYELYLLDRKRGSDLWNLVAEAGQPYDIGPGAPNPIERIESFLLSYRGDTPDDADPFEARLERFVDLDADVEFIGRAALAAKRADGLSRQLVGLRIDGDPIKTPEHPWPVSSVTTKPFESETRPINTPEHPWPVSSAVQQAGSDKNDKTAASGEHVGEVRAAAFSPRLGHNIGLGLINVPHNRTGTAVVIHHPTGPRTGITADIPFCPPGPAA